MSRWKLSTRAMLMRSRKLLPAMIQSDYASFDGLSGAGVVAKVVGSVCKVIGVHVASHDRTVPH